MGLREQLNRYLAKLASGGLCVAFSGGVDSALLLKLCCAAAPGAVHAVTLSTPFHTAGEREEAVAFAAACGAEHIVLSHPTLPDDILANPPDRCYRCKKFLFAAIRTHADSHGLTYLLDGTNADDLTQYRPGLRALAELGVRSPFAELGFSKADVRAVAAELGLSVAEKPSAPCLATRFPYHTPIRLELLPRVAAVEEAVRNTGIPVVRARVHEDTIRLEVPAEHFPTVLQNRESLLSAVRGAGFRRFTLDLAGYESGSFDAPYRTATTEKGMDA